MVNKKALVLYAFNHSGHQSAADSISKSLKDLYPDWEIKTLNVLECISPHCEKVVSFFYKSLSLKMPWLWKWLYNNFCIHKAFTRLREYGFMFGASRMQCIVNQSNPDFVLCTQAIPAGIVSFLKAKYDFSFSALAVLTDFFPNIYWVNANIDYYIVATKEAAALLSEWGVDKDRIVLIGIPVHPVFAVSRKNWETLNNDKPSVLIMGGKRGWGRIEEMIGELTRTAIDLRIMTVCGTNMRLYDSLMRTKYIKEVEVFGNIEAEQMNNLMELSSIVVSKAGGLTLAESLAKGLPLLLVDCIAGQEESNSMFLSHEGAAVRVKVSEVAKTIESLLSNSSTAFQTLRENAKKIGRPLASYEIANFLGVIS
jgi:processive 1,2-diacylglycerol beta-glucosyltransferase